MFNDFHSQYIFVNGFFQKKLYMINVVGYALTNHGLNKDMYIGNQIIEVRYGQLVNVVSCS